MLSEKLNQTTKMWDDNYIDMPEIFPILVEKPTSVRTVKPLILKMSSDKVKKNTWGEITSQNRKSNRLVQITSPKRVKRRILKLSDLAEYNLVKSTIN